MNQVKGYNKLSQSDKMVFDAFCNNYRSANGSEIEITYISVKRERDYLRVDLLRNGTVTWQQVFSSTSWG